MSVGNRSPYRPVIPLANGHVFAPVNEFHPAERPACGKLQDETALILRRVQAPPGPEKVV